MRIGSYRSMPDAQEAASLWHPHHNPLSGASEAALYAGGFVAALGVGYWLFSAKPAKAASSLPTAASGTIVLQPGTQSAKVGGSPLTLTLPAGAVWGANLTDAGQTAPNQYAGTNTPVTIPPNPKFAGQTVTIGLQWTDASGTAQTTTLTVAE